MQINSINNQTNFNGLGKFLGIKTYRRNTIIRPKFKKPETVVVHPDGTIERGKLAKICQRTDEIVMSILEKIFS